MLSNYLFTNYLNTKHLQRELLKKKQELNKSRGIDKLTSNIRNLTDNKLQVMVGVLAASDKKKKKPFLTFD